MDYSKENREKVIRNWTRNLSSPGAPQTEESAANPNLPSEVRNVPVHEVKKFEFLDSVSSSDSDTEMDISLPVRNEEPSLSDLDVLEVLSIPDSSSSSVSSISDDSQDCANVIPPVSSSASSPIHSPSNSRKPKNSRKRVGSIPSEPTNLMSMYLKLVSTRIRSESWTRRETWIRNNTRSIPYEDHDADTSDSN